jgi:hypothetical protein
MNLPRQRHTSARAPSPPAERRRAARATLAAVLATALLAAQVAPALAAAGSVGSSSAGAGRSSAQAVSGGEGSQLESAAHKAGETGRKVAMSLIALGFAIAAIVLAFRRDFKEAVGVFAIGIVAVLLAQETGVKLVQNLVHSLFGS